ncbi:site-2 protease family protein [Bordetella sp. FB-8]|uniref:site-2 protease family protein n=1 Tax=Bordetella sp. FB-8 TaxID=1159870 RepID=UPI00036D6FF1|nr:site-2 protease family protein [Bordetella sp. FB-8]
MGISIGLDYSWFVVFALLTWSLAEGYFPADYPQSTPVLYWAAGAMTAVMVFASVLLHELGHSAVALRYRISVRSITLFIFGGVAQIDAQPPNALAEFFIAIAGPLVSLALAVVFFIAQPLLAGAGPLPGMAGYLAYLNLSLALFNLIPGYPLDGGRVLRAIVWAATRSLQRATLIAANVGRFFGLLFIFLGVLQVLHGNVGTGLWVAFIGWFLDSAAHAQVVQVRVQDMMAGHSVAQAMNTHCATIPADMALQELVDRFVLANGQRSFLVERDGRIVGLATLHQIKAVPTQQWAATRVDQAMLSLEKAKCIEAEAELCTALQVMDRNGVNQLPVTRDRHVVGMLNREDIITFLRTVFEFKARGPSTR